MSQFDVTSLIVIDGFSLHSEIPLEDQTVVATTSDDSHRLGVELQAGDWAWRLKDVDWCVWIGDVPDIGLIWHLVWHLLESLNGVSNGQLTDSLWMPSDFAHSSFDIFLIFQ